MSIRKKPDSTALPHLLRRISFPSTTCPPQLHNTRSPFLIYSYIAVSNSSVKCPCSFSVATAPFLPNPRVFPRNYIYSQSSGEFSDARCWNYDAQPKGGLFLVCDSCSGIQPADHSMDYLRLLEKEKYEIGDAHLHDKYKEWQKKLHPDLAHSKSERNFSREQSARVGDAYRTLISPVLGAMYNMKTVGVDVNEEETILDPNHSQQQQQCMTEKECLVKPVLKGYLKQDLQEVCNILTSSSVWSVIYEALENSTVKFTPELVLEVQRNCNIHGTQLLLLGRKATWIFPNCRYIQHDHENIRTRALCGAGRLEEAISVVDEGWGDHNKLKLDRSTYASLAHGLLRTGKTEEAFAKLKYMKKVSIHPTAHVYTSLIVHFFKEEQREKAEETLEAMQREGCKPTIVTYSAMILGYMKLGRTCKAWTVFRRLRKEGHPRFSDVFNVH
ncbi:unnamed protein product [Linum trigynum]|uniref:Pentatricopeptide repeat-containing protein n=1 Tax=Linum trigynum TaxID=586398 RepID=A0AAV2DD33_9ROSI